MVSILASLSVCFDGLATVVSQKSTHCGDLNIGQSRTGEQFVQWPQYWLALLELSMVPQHWPAVEVSSLSSPAIAKTTQFWVIYYGMHVSNITLATVMD
jgi:hypothetical protein